MFSELPVGAIYAELKTGLDRKQQENHTGNDVKVKNILDKESLESSEVGILVDGRRYRIIREDLVNCDQTLGISSFHGEKSPNFSLKALIFRFFCQ